MAGRNERRKSLQILKKMFSGDWRIGADERIKYDSYYQQCNPIQGYVTGTNWKILSTKKTFFLR